MKGLKKFNFVLSLVLSLLALLSVIGCEKAQKNNPSTLMKVAEGYKNKYEFKDALVWYEKLIQAFPDTLEAGNASLNKLAILSAESNWYYVLVLNYMMLYKAQFDSGYDPSIRKMLIRKSEYHRKKAHHLGLKYLQKSKALKEEFYRFEKDYSSMLNQLSSPHINMYTGDIPPITPMEIETIDIQKMFAIGKDDSYLKSESLKKSSLENYLTIFCLKYTILGGTEPTKEDLASYYNKEYIKHKIDPIGFYYWLGKCLMFGYQCKSAVKAFTTVINLAQDENDKLTSDAKNWLSFLKHRGSKANLEADLMIYFSQDEIDKYVEPYTNDNIEDIIK